MVGSLTLNSNTELLTGDGDKKFKKKDTLSFTLITRSDGEKKVNNFKVCAVILVKCVLVFSSSANK